MTKIQNPSSREVPSSNPELDRAGGDWPLPVIVESACVLREDGTGTNHPFDLEERCACFGEEIVKVCKRIPRGPGNDRIIDQLVGAGTSVGANYCEANESVSKKDFRFSISRCKKEAKESGHFLRMAATSEPILSDDARRLYREARELQLIFAAMYRK